jgi:CHAT domain-containing protein/tetratricopeptide (TPR) repeat protein
MYRVLCALSTSLLLPLPLAKPQAQSTTPDSNRQQVLQSAVNDFFAAWQRKDPAAVQARWNEKSPHLSLHKVALEQHFAVTRRIEFGNPAISKVKVDDNRAELEAAVTATITTNNDEPRQELWVRKFEFVPDGAQWKVWRYSSASDDLAEALVQAQTDAEREKLLDSRKDLVTAELAQALIVHSTLLLRQNRRPQALPVIGIAERIAEQTGDKTTLGRAHMSFALIYRSEGKYNQALEGYARALASFEAVEFTAGIALALNNLSAVHMDQGNYTQAVGYAEKSLAMSEGQPAARPLLNLGILNMILGNYDLALEFFGKLESGGHTREKDMDARRLYGIAQVYDSLGNFGEAMAYYLRSMALFEALGERANVASVLNAIGNIHDSQDNYAQALDYYQKSLALKEALNLKTRIGPTLNNLGNVHRKQGQFEKALEYYRRSLAIGEAQRARSDMGIALSGIGLVHRSKGELNEALAYLQKSLVIREGTGDRQAMGYVLNGMSEVYQEQGRYAQALETAQRAVALGEQIGSREILWKASLRAGIAHRSLDQPEQARRAVEQAIAAIESLRGQVAGGEQEQQKFFESRTSPYHAMVQLLADQDKPDEALAFAERAKSRVLLDVLQAGQIDVAKAMTPQEREKERTFNNQLTSLNARISREKLSAHSDPKILTELNTQLDKLRLDMEAFRTVLYASHPELRVQRGEIPFLTLEQAGELLPDAATAVLEFVVSEENTRLFVLTRREEGNQPATNLSVHTVKFSQKDLVARVEQFRRMLAAADNRFRGGARELHDLLMAPATEQLRGISRLIIVPDGPLWELPFQALVTSRSRYVIEDYVVSYAPSLAVLKEMTRLRHQKRRTAEAATLFALGNPALGKETVARVKAVFMDEELEPLPEAEQQVRNLQRIYGPDHSRAYVGADAREERFKAEAGRYDILHLATHGILNDRNPLYSHLLLSQTGDGGKDDGLLEAWELMKLDLNADLAVLSACETARGRVGKGEGMIGFTWALFVAGVPTAVVSQWKVRSDSTAALMVELHRRLRSSSAKTSGSRVAEALREAALKVKADKRYRHPFHWAGFVAMGDAQ